MSATFFGCATLVACCGLLSAVATAAPPLEAYGQLPAARDAVLSPDGKRYALIVGNDAETQAQAYDAATGKLLAGARTDALKARSLLWGDNDHLLITVSATTGVAQASNSRGEWYQLNALNVTNGKIVQMLNRIERGFNVVAGPPRRFNIDGKPVVIVEGMSFPGSRGASTLYRVSLDTGRSQEVEVGLPETDDWVLGADGRPVARADFDRQAGEWRLFTRPGALWKRGYSEKASLDRPYLLSLGPTNATLLAVSRRSGEYETYEVTVADGSWSAPKAEYDAESILTDPASKLLIGTIDYTLSGADYRFFSESDQRLWRSILKAFPGDLVSLASWSDDRMSIIVEVEGPGIGDAYFLIDRSAKTARKLADRYPALTPTDFAPVSAFHYAAADGTDIPAYLTLPRRAVTSNLPLIVLPHGGPSSRDYPGFDWWAQALASRGYAVLQPQFRGSDGFGGAFRDAGFGEWGKKMQTDLSDGVRHLAKAGTIDPKRVCIVGASYGGYAALAGVTLDPGVYRCASAVAGVSDLRQMLVSEVSSYGGEKRNLSQRWWRRYMGVENSDDPKLLAISPARHAANVKVPVQLIHGKDDTVVDYEQSVTMDKALKAAGNPAEFITLEGEDHWLSRSVTRKQMLAAMVAFLEKHNPPGASAP